MPKKLVARGADGTTRDTILAQWECIKAEYPDMLVFMRVGDFAEAFDKDAEVAAKLLNLVTVYAAGRAMAGFPFVEFEKHAGLLINAGHKIALAEQVTP